MSTLAWGSGTHKRTFCSLTCKRSYRPTLKSIRLEAERAGKCPVCKRQHTDARVTTRYTPAEEEKLRYFIDTIRLLLDKDPMPRRKS